MYQMRSPSSACAGLDADDRVSVLPGGRAMVSPAVTYRTGLRNCPSDRQYLFHGLLTSEALKKVSTNPPDLRHGAARATFRPTGFDVDITSNASADIVEIMGALVEIHDKSIRFQHEMHRRRRLHMSLSRIEPQGHQPPEDRQLRPGCRA
jgi:hypothetical protein